MIIEPIPGHLDTSLRLITRTTRFHNVLPANVDLLKNGVFCEGRDVSSLKELLRVVTDLWSKGIGESPSKVQLAVILHKMLMQSFPEYSVEISIEVNKVVRSLPRIHAGMSRAMTDAQSVNNPPKQMDLKTRLVEMGDCLDWGFWEIVMNYHTLDEFSACWLTFDLMLKRGYIS